MWAFESIESVKLINRVDIASPDEQVVDLLLQDVILSNDAVQDLLEELYEASAIVDLLIGSLKEGDDLEDGWCDGCQHLLVGEVIGDLGDEFLDDSPASPLGEPLVGMRVLLVEDVIGDECLLILLVDDLVGLALSECVVDVLDGLKADGLGVATHV